MLFEFYPWTIEADSEKTKAFFKKHDISVDRDVNRRFIKALTENQLAFFESLGVDPERIYIDEQEYCIPPEDGMPECQLFKMSIHFLICGEFKALPQFQKSLYSDPDFFGDELPKDLKIVKSREDDLPSYDVDGLKFVFKHPKFRNNNPMFDSWNCGYILVSSLVIKDS